MSVILIAIGLLFLGIDIHVATGILYPAYVEPQGEFLGTTIQTEIQKVINSHILSNQFQLDVLPDVVGCILIVVGMFLAVKHNKKYFFCMGLAVITGILSIALRVMPFFINSAALIVTVLCIFALYTVAELWLEYKVIATTVDISDALANQGTNKRMQFVWGISVFARMFIALLTFSGLESPMKVYKVLAGVFIVLYLFMFLQARNYVGTYRVWKEGFNCAVIPDYVKEAMDEVVPGGYTGDLEELRFVRILTYDSYQRVQEGQLVVNQKIALQTMKVFHQLYKWQCVFGKIYQMEVIQDGMAIRVNQDECVEKEQEIIEKIFKRNGFSREIKEGKQYFVAE